MEIFQIITALFIFLFLVAPGVMLIVVLVGGRNSKQTPIQSIKLEELEQNDYTIIEDTNKAFHDVSQTLKSIEKRIDDIEKKIERAILVGVHKGLKNVLDDSTDESLDELARLADTAGAVMVFADDTARGSAIPSPSEGMVTYLEDSNQVQVYNGTSFGPIGTILQVVSTTKTDTFSLTSTTFTDVTGLSVSITPSSSSSTILVMASVVIGAETNVNAFVRLLRDSTLIAAGDAAGSRARGFGQNRALDGFDARAQSVNFLDSPSTASSVTYKIQLAGNVSAPVYVNRNDGDTDSFSNMRGASTITVMEVAG
jgi:hypothetical protein